MLAKFTKFTIFILALAVLSTAGAFVIQTAFAAWTSPTTNPPDGNVNALIFNGDSSVYLGSSVVSQFLTLKEDAGYPTKFYFDSKKGVQVRLDSDNNDANSAFTVNNGLNAEIFKVDEVGLVTVINKITGLLTPTVATDAATKAYVDAAVGAAGGGDATLANQESMMGTGFVKDTDSLKNIRANLAALATSISSEHGQILSELQKLVGYASILTYSGATHTGNDCLAQPGGSIYSSPSGTLCKITGTNVSCSSGWTQAGNWQTYSVIGWGDSNGDDCGRYADSGPVSFADAVANNYEQGSYFGAASWGLTSCSNWGCTSYWCVDVPSVPDGSYGSYTDYNSSVSTNPATNRTAIGCK